MPPASVIPKPPVGNLASSKKLPIAVVKNVSAKVAKVFGSDSDEEVLFEIYFFFSFFYLTILFINKLKAEEMPLEAKMKMRNVGR